MTKGKPKKIVCDNEFNCTNVKNFLMSENIEVHFTKPNSHTGNSDIERFRSTILEKLRSIGLEKTELSTKEKMFKSIELYNRSFHSTVRASQLDIMNGKIDRGITYELLKNSKMKIIEKRNKNREEYIVDRKEGYVKNYKALRHKEMPKFRKLKLENVHPTNIKRLHKFTDDMDISQYDNDSNTSRNNGYSGYSTD